MKVVRTRLAVLADWWGVRGKLLGNSCGSSANSCGIIGELWGLREKLLDNLCGSSAKSCDITGELVGTSWEIVGDLLRFLGGSARFPNVFPLGFTRLFIEEFAGDSLELMGNKCRCCGEFVLIVWGFVRK